MEQKRIGIEERNSFEFIVALKGGRAKGGVYIYFCLNVLV